MSRAEVANLLEEISVYKNYIITESKRTENLANELKNKTDELCGNHNQLSVLISENQKLKTEKDALNREIGNLRKSQESGRMEIGTKDLEIDRLKEQVLQFSKECTDISKQLNAKEAQLNNLQIAFHRLDIQGDENERLSKRNTELINENKQLNENYAEVCERNKCLNKELAILSPNRRNEHAGGANEPGPSYVNARRYQ
ncbi:unnamed protein product [Caenorhabditis sp. 36 PRJEB53466]|nr:unnamed protein product [Caenorhabditis sp. 36 PRJEB53466]